VSPIVSRRQTTGERQYRWTAGAQQVCDVALAILYRGDELIDKRRRIVAIEFGMWRSGRSGGTAGSITFG
jgi:hypothetical protein